MLSNGAAGGVGSIAIQLAKAGGDHVVVAAIAGVLAALVLPFVYDPNCRSYLLESQARMLREGDVVILAAPSRAGWRVDYRLDAVWRNRHGVELPWRAGEPLPALSYTTDAVHPPDKIVFYRQVDGGLHAHDGEVALKVDIRARNRLQRWLGWRVPMEAVRRHVGQAERTGRGAGVRPFAPGDGVRPGGARGYTRLFPAPGSHSLPRGAGAFP